MDSNFENLRVGEKFLPNSYRTKRLLQIGDKWFFLTRENTLPLGPFSSEEQAYKAACDYADFAHGATPNMLEKLQLHLVQNG